MNIDPELGKLIQSLENQLLTADVRKSKVQLSELLADDFLEVASSGKIYDKADILAHLPLAPERLFYMEAFRVRSLSPEVVLATYRLKSFSMPQTRPQRTLRSSIWRLKGDQWRLIFHQGTPIHEYDWHD